MSVNRKPRKPVLPTEPKRRVMNSARINLVSGATIDEVLRNIPEGIALDKVCLYADGCYDDDIELYLTWEVEIDNAKYDQDYIRYLERLKAYEQSALTYDSALKAWEEAEAAKKLLVSTRIQQLESEIAKLKAGQGVSPHGE